MLLLLHFGDVIFLLSSLVFRFCCPVSMVELGGRILQMAPKGVKTDPNSAAEKLIDSF